MNEIELNPDFIFYPLSKSNQISCMKNSKDLIDENMNHQFLKINHKRLPKGTKRIECSCGSKFQYGNRGQHFVSMHHQEFLQKFLKRKQYEKNEELNIYELCVPLGLTKEKKNETLPSSGCEVSTSIDFSYFAHNSSPVSSTISNVASSSSSISSKTFSSSTTLKTKEEKEKDDENKDDRFDEDNDKRERKKEMFEEKQTETIQSENQSENQTQYQQKNENKNIEEDTKEKKKETNILNHFFEKYEWTQNPNDGVLIHQISIGPWKQLRNELQKLNIEMDAKEIVMYGVKEKEKGKKREMIKEEKEKSNESLTQENKIKFHKSNDRIEFSSSPSLLSKPTGDKDDKQKKKKKHIPPKLREMVWNRRVGKGISFHRCFCCKTKEMTMYDFEAGHVLAEAKGGTTELDNLIPICSQCNRSMGTKNMRDYISENGFHLPL